MSVSRLEEMLEAVCNGENCEITPKSRTEKYLLAFLKGETDVPEPRTRIEAYLCQMCKSGGGGGTKTHTVTINWLTFENSDAYWKNEFIPHTDTGVFAIDGNPREVSVYGAYKNVSTMVIPNVPDGASILISSDLYKGSGGMASAHIVEGDCAVDTNKYSYEAEGANLYMLYISDIHSDCVVNWRDEA